MVTSFIADSKLKHKNHGPHGRALLSIRNNLQKSSTLKSRKVIGKRIGSKCNRQKRDVHLVNRVGTDIIGKFMYYNWGTKESFQITDSIKCVESDIVDVSDYSIITESTMSRHSIVLDADNGNNFIFAKIAKTQSNECMGGRKALNKIRNTFSSMKRMKPNQKRGKDTTAFSTSYKLFGHRKDHLGRFNGEYVFKSKHKLSTADTNNISFLYCNLSYNMERASRRIGNSLFETGVYEIIQSHSKVPTVSVPRNVDEAKKKIPMATALAIGENYWSKSHIDNDFYFTSLSVLSKHSRDTQKILYYFIFPMYKIMVPMVSGDVILFNPSITHSCSNPSLPNSYIFSSYVSKKTVLTAEVKMEYERNNE